MKQHRITKEMTVFEVLEYVPGAIALFRTYGVNPTGECGPMTRELCLRDVEERCRLEDVDELIFELNVILRKNEVLANG